MQIRGWDVEVWQQYRDGTSTWRSVWIIINSATPFITSSIQRDLRFFNNNKLHLQRTSLLSASCLEVFQCLFLFLFYYVRLFLWFNRQEIKTVAAKQYRPQQQTIHWPNTVMRHLQEIITTKFCIYTTSICLISKIRFNINQKIITRGMFEIFK